MKVLLFVGTHPRHLFFHKTIIDSGVDYFAVVMKRGGLIPATPKNILEQDKKNYTRHFKERNEIEIKNFGNLKVSDVFEDSRTITVDSLNLNSVSVKEKILKFNADIAIIFGVHLIKEPVFNILPDYKINLHLGLSPWYRGSATLFWPFYYLKPQFAGLTLHNISNKPDSGDIFHQSTPKLSKGDGIHNVAAKVVIDGSKEVLKMLKKFNKEKKLSFQSQKTTGRLWLGKDFKPIHLRVIYDLFENQIVDEYLSGNLDNDLPNLICGFN